MAELGDASETYHREIGAAAANLGIEVVGVGEPARAYAPVAWAPTPDEALDLVRSLIEPGDAVLVKASRAVGTRRHRRRDHELRPHMVPVLIAGLIAMVAAVVIGPKFIEVLRARNLGQQIRAEGPATHIVKQGTPTMGGLLIIASAVIPVPLPVPVHGGGADRALHRPRMRGDRVHGRLPEAQAPPLARACRGAGRWSGSSPSRSARRYS